MPSRVVMIVTLILLATLAISGSAYAQWSADANLPVADLSGEQVQPKIVPSGDGGVYVSWFDNNGGGYDVRIQRLDAAGVEQWPHNGVLVADRGFSSTQDYGLAVGADGSALLAFRDDRFTGTQITAARIAADGTLTWGPDGVQLTSDTAFHAAPGIAGTADGGIVVGWTNDGDVKLQRLDADGVPQWGAGVTLTDATGDMSFSDIHEAGAASVILSWVRADAFLAPRHLHAQKLDADGVPRWNGGAPVVVFDGGSLQVGNFPDFVGDGSGGAVFGWYENSPLQCRAQHILAAGTEAFPHNGSVGSTNGSNNRVSPDVAYNRATGETFLFWTELNGAQSMQGVSGQRFDAAGARLWGATGVTILPLSSNVRSFVHTEILDDGAVVAFFDSVSFGNDSVRAARVDGSGSFVWTPTIVDVSQQSGELGRLAMAMPTPGEAVLAWQDGGFGSADLLAQNLNADGTLGPADEPCLGDISGPDGLVNVNDLVAVITGWGTPAGDVDGDGLTNVFDLVTVILAWGPCP